MPKIEKDFQHRKDYKPILAVLLLIAIWYILIGKDLLANFNLGDIKKYEQSERMRYEFPCSEANLAKIVALTLGEVKAVEVEDTLWYEKYYDEVEKLGVQSLKKEEAFKIVSGKKIEGVLEELECGNVHIESKAQLDLYEVIEIYEKSLKASDKKYKEIEYQSAVVLLTPTDEMSLTAWQALTDKGNINFEGLVLDPLKNKTIQIACVNDHLLGVMEIESENCTIQGCKINEVTNKKVKVEIKGHSFEYENQNIKEEEIGKIGSLMLEEGKAVAFDSENLEADTLLALSDHEIELEKAGKLKYDELVIEDETGKGIYNHLSDLCYGLKVSYIAHEGKVTRLKVINESNLNEIRVVLHSENQTYLQEEVKLSSDQAYDKMVDGKATTFEAGEEWCATQYDWKEGERIRFVPRTEESKMKILSLTRNETIPSYYGAIEVIKYSNGYVIINEVDIEDYVAGVLPSEMPTSYGKEALKAQAIAIRTYGLAAKKSASFLAYSAHVDDTTATQVYNRVIGDEKAQNAVEETRGLVLKSEGKLIQNKFFATSCGYTANSGEVWASDHFPGKSLDYLVSRRQYTGDQLESPKSEEAFKKFIKLTAEDIDAFDEDSPWFRWQVELNKEALEKLLIPSIQKLVEEENTGVDCKVNEKLTSNHQSIEQMGEIKEMKVLQRGEGGNVMRLEITFDKGSITVQTEYLIRKLFSSNENQGLIVTRSDGSKVYKMNLLPSAFFIIEQEKDQEEKIKKITLVGGGNGHGVGLSQDGAKGMAQRGYRYDEILEHYYKDCEIVVGE